MSGFYDGIILDGFLFTKLETVAGILDIN